MTTLVFVDCETLGLDPVRHAIWEVAAIVRRPGMPDEEYLWQIRLTDDQIEASDPKGAEVSGFLTRYERGVATAPRNFAGEFADLTLDRAHLVGNVPSFDERRLGDLLRAEGRAPGWHYHLIDVENLAVGYLLAQRAYLENDSLHDDMGTPDRMGRRQTAALIAETAAPPWSSEKLMDLLGVPVPDKTARHTALGDARWARDVWDAIHR